MTKNRVMEEVMPMGIADWEFNPRGGELRGIPEFAEVLKREGILEPGHVFLRNGVLTAIQCHRRKAAAVLAGIPTMKVWNYGALTDREAFELLISIQNGNDPFDARELSMAARTAVKHMGMTSAEVAQVFHRSAETVQLYLDLETLPHRVQEAVWKGLVSLEVADLMRQLSSKEKQEEALQLILHDKITGQPMSGALARVFLQEAYLKPQRWEREWAKMSPGLRKKHEGAQIVAWEDREEYVMQDVLPEDGYARFEEYIDAALLVNPAEPLTWGGLAGVYGVPVFVAPAMAISAKHLVLVPMKAVREADAGAEEPRMGRAKRGMTKPEGRNQNEGDDAPQRLQGRGDEGGMENDEVDDQDGAGKSARAPFVYDLERWKGMLAALLQRPDAIRADGPWKPLMGMQWEALAAVLPAEVYAAMMGELNRDENERRKGLRWCFLALAALSLCEGNAKEMEESLRECEAALGTR